jgi:MoxR-like ATPase
VFKANSAILNALLTLLNEREFDNGAGRLHTPLISVVGASNEAPSDESLLAFHDRFLLRVPVQPVSDDAFAQLLLLDDRAGTPTATPAVPATRPAPITPAERAAVASAGERVVLSDEALAALAALRREVAELGLPVSDRRWRQLVALMRCAAVLEGRPAVDALDLWLAPYVASPDGQAVPALGDWVAEVLVQAVPQPLPWLQQAVAAFERQLDLEQRLPAEGQGSDDSAGKLALARAVGGSEGDNGLLRIVASALEDQLRRRFSPVHVAARVAQVEEVAERARAVQVQAQAALDQLAARLAGRLWLPPGVAARWCDAHRQTLQAAEACLARLADCRAGFAALPVDPAQAAVPAPVSLG